MDPLTAAIEAFRPYREQLEAKRRQQEERLCAECGDTFISGQPTRRFCDAQCRSKYFDARRNNAKHQPKLAAAPPAPVKAAPAKRFASLEEAEAHIAELERTIRRLQEAITAAERRVELSEASVQRAYQAFCVGGRR